MSRVRRVPPKFRSYWDMTIPTEYYQDEFLQFERFLKFAMKRRPRSFEDVDVSADFYLDEFKRYEKDQKKENKKIYREMRKINTSLEDRSVGCKYKKVQKSKKNALSVPEDEDGQELNVSIVCKNS